jgi:protein AroM
MIALISIGQSPRADIVSELKPILGKDIIECGALDGLSKEEIGRLASEEDFFVTLLKDGTQVRVNKEKIADRMQTCVDRMENKAGIIGILCTGEFPELRSSRILIKPSTLLLKSVEILGPDKLGVLIPEKEQEGVARKKWLCTGREVEVKALSPYLAGEQEVRRATSGLKKCGAVVLDCIGYTLRTKELVKKTTGKPVLLPRTLLAGFINEIIT